LNRQDGAGRWHAQVVAKLPPARLAREASAEVGFDVWAIAGIKVQSGDDVVVRFLGKRGDEQRGLFLGTIGMLEIPATGASHDQFLIGFDADEPCALKVLETDGSLRFYPAISDDDGRPRTQMNNQSLTQTGTDGATITYTCSDPGRALVFGAMDFSITVVRRSA